MRSFFKLLAKQHILLHLSDSHFDRLRKSCALFFYTVIAYALYFSLKLEVMLASTISNQWSFRAIHSYYRVNIYFDSPSSTLIVIEFIQR